MNNPTVVRMGKSYQEKLKDWAEKKRLSQKRSIELILNRYLLLEEKKLIKEENEKIIIYKER